ncbi:MAG TPA: 2-phospho-L-lactate transferase CofD family protein [Candidatus Limnocylindria bacterium]|nr:2-phospho-L-lactate transferase CofD family protein [Candidatus Limnocylindria bacterium]
METARNVTIIGGGGGVSVITPAFAALSSPGKTTAVAAESDSGGSSGEWVELMKKERPDAAALPPGDCRRIIASVAASQRIGEALNYRFGPKSLNEAVTDLTEAIGDVGLALNTSVIDAVYEANDMLEGALQRHPLGNLVLGRLAMEEGFSSAVQTVSELVGARARVLPVTVTPHALVADTGTHRLVGEHIIDKAAVDWLAADIHFSSAVDLGPGVRSAVASADLVVVPPGSMDTSIAAALRVRGMAEELQHQKEAGGKFIAVTNLVTPVKDNYARDVADHVMAIQRWSGRELDGVIYNNAFDKLPDPARAVPVDVARLLELGVLAVGADLVGRIVPKKPDDSLARAEVEHNASVVAELAYQHFLSRQLVPA